MFDPVRLYSFDYWHNFYDATQHAEHQLNRGFFNYFFERQWPILVGKALVSLLIAL
jgi:hypothetical protein